MTVDDLKRHFKRKTLESVGSVIGKSKGTLSLWNSKGIPVEQQALIQVRTNNALKADISSLPELKEA